MTTPSEINLGPCTAWTDAAAIAECCNVADTTVDLDLIADEASAILYAITGHRFSGICTSVVRPCPCATPCCARWPGLPPDIMPGGPSWVDGWPGGWLLDQQCGCSRLPKVALAGYPARQILDVQIDGVSLDPATYRLDRRRDLVRLNGLRWPGCQALDRDSGVGTWFVTYEHGVAPPLIGSRAATELGCALLRTCHEDRDCELPAGTVRVTRQGLTIEATSLGLWLLGTSRTGMAAVDAFLSVYAEVRRRPTALAVPEAPRFPMRVE